MSLFTLYIVNKSGGLVYNKDISPASAKMSGNEVLMAASTFHSLHAISKQLAPVASGGIQSVDAPNFSLHCYESPTGVKFFVTSRPKATDASTFIRKVYEFYGDYVLKVRNGAGGSCYTFCSVQQERERRCLCKLTLLLQNPFYELDMPIRIKLFDAAIDSYSRSSGLATGVR